MWCSRAKASGVADWSFSSSETMPRQASEETIAVERKCLRAKVDLPEPLVPIRTTRDSSGTASVRHLPVASFGFGSWSGPEHRDIARVQVVSTGFSCLAG